MTSRARREAPTTAPAERARELALAMLTRGPRSSADLRERLISKEIEPDVADEVIARYREVGLLDDESLAATIARTRHAERGLAPRAISQELRRKGFGEEHIQAALEPLTAEVQEDRARELAAKRWHKDSAASPDARVRRTVAFLARKGYAASLAFALVRDLQRADSETGGN
ncbi:RecX family transcriptional regulator [Demequina sp. TTPB684]|uniref:regulatory protein RecX n=1 Tax=unclassified Demequina TaxID=2620311 RepID=UPI001CF3BF13|nr:MULTISPECIES: regulatory protein RecX [unclassified Demequina]MCB2413733.1 RecX family transcriptional regulator [Demequina sp. TTPB684]UPU89596.1 RecX family transcriptional regulator [Demequina sp. TMPB413]